MLRNPLSFKPTDEEEQYLLESGKLTSWSETVHNWIKNEMQQDKKKLYDELASYLLYISAGVLFGLIGFLIHPVTLLNMVLSVTFILFGFTLIVLTVIRIYARLGKFIKKKNKNGG